jgi:CubicO group peptidase (beta-lactamase class C family)
MANTGKLFFSISPHLNIIYLSSKKRMKKLLVLLAVITVLASSAFSNTNYYANPIDTTKPQKALQIVQPTTASQKPDDYESEADKKEAASQQKEKEKSINKLNTEATASVIQQLKVKITATTPGFIKDSLFNYILRGMSQWQVPGLAIVIVKDGQVVLRRGFGVKDIATKELVDEQTAFFIASNSKLFTGTALAQLEYQRKLSLNDKITKYYPEYKLYEKTSTELVTIKDMLSHRIGTKTFQGDFTFWNSNLSREEVMKRMRYLQPINPFRQDYGYCNSCFLTAGQIIPKVTNRQWEEYITDSILRPLGMNNSYALSNGIETRVKNIAVPYSTSFTNQLKVVPYDRWDNLAPAASIVSNVKDLTNWLFFQLDSGRYNGKRIMPWAVLQKTRDVNIITGSRKSPILPVHFRGYGLGLFSADYNGRQIYWHTGGAAGMVSNVCFVPEEKLGIAILTNNDNQNFFESLRFQLLDAYLGVAYVDRSKQQLDDFNKEMKTQVQEVEAWNKQAADFKAKNLVTTLTGKESFTGTYTNELYGSLTITKNNDYEYSIKFNSHQNLEATLRPLNKTDWLLAYKNIEYGIFITKFETDEAGKVKNIKIKANDFVEYDSYIFSK